ncbi:MAG: hypothetical protein ACE5NG_08170 [bacterium]
MSNGRIGSKHLTVAGGINRRALATNACLCLLLKQSTGVSTPAQTAVAGLNLRFNTCITLGLSAVGLSAKRRRVE